MASGKKLTIRSPEEAIRNGIALFLKIGRACYAHIEASLKILLYHNEFFRGSTLSREKQILTSSIEKTFCCNAI